MIIIPSNGPGTESPTPEKLRLLKECDEISTYPECGWYCVIGYKERRKVVTLHSNSRNEYMSMTGQGRPGDWDRRYGKPAGIKIRTWDWAIRQYEIQSRTKAALGGSAAP